MTIQAVLFDLDNTLYPPSAGLMGAFDERITAYVQQLLGLEREAAWALRQQFFREYGTTLRGLQQHHEVDVEAYLVYVHDMEMRAYLAADARLDAALGALRSRKAIFTNSPREHAERVLSALAIERHFERIFDVRYFNFSPKPDPACYHSALGDLGVAGAATVLVEDTARNLPPARALGMTTILLAEDTAAPHPDADYVVPDVHAALGVIRELEQAG